MQILQLNVNRSRASHRLLGANATQRQADALVVSEPNRHIIAGGNWKSDPQGDSAILLLNARKAVLQTGTGQGFVWIELADLRIFSCYFSPNKPMVEITQALDQMADAIRSSPKRAIIAGDFNAKSPLWGEYREDQRGRFLTDWAAALSLTCLNEGTDPTFTRGGASSILDITFCTEGAERKLHSWSILETETLSDHQCIEIKLIDRQTSPVENHYAKGWRVDVAGCDRLKNSLERKLGELVAKSPSALTEVISSACKESLRTKRSFAKRKPSYWWTTDIAVLRTECVRARRRLTRENRRTGGQAAEHLKAELAQAKRVFRMEILKSMRMRWIEVCESVNEDVWGTGYKIVRKKLSRGLPVLTTEITLQVVETLFPNHPAVRYEEIAATEIPLFTEGELEEARKKMKPKKSPGPDGIPPEAVKLAAEIDPTKVLQALNCALTKEQFPSEWKQANLILIKKQGKPDNLPSSYRPLCLLDTLGKLLEHLLLGRLKGEIERTGGLAENQFGFVEGRSTLNAMQRVMDLVDRAARGNRRTRRFPAVVTLDIRNAFNSASWQRILEILKQRGVSDYLRRMIQQYLKERTIRMRSDKDCLQKEVTSGVPQGSILGPTLWNLLYDGVLRLRLPEGAALVGYADDLALVVSAATEQMLMNKANTAIGMVGTWLEENGLAIAPEKTEAIVMSGRRAVGNIRFEVNGVLIQPSNKLKYLGVWLDKRRSFRSHVEETAKKSGKVVGCLSRLMGNVQGPSPSKRKLLGTVVESTALYAAPIWIRALDSAKSRLKLDQVQRKIALRICSGYRTISAEAAFVIAGVPPMTLLAAERTDCWLGADKVQARNAMLDRWQERWTNSATGAWTRILIPDLVGWMRRTHGELDFYLTQFFSGHGMFQKYLLRIQKAESGDCRYCGEEDTAEHTVLECERWERLRSPYITQVGNLNSNNIVGKMLESKDQWDITARMVREIMKQKIIESRLDF